MERPNKGQIFKGKIQKYIIKYSKFSWGNVPKMDTITFPQSFPRRPISKSQIIAMSVVLCIKAAFRQLFSACVSACCCVFKLITLVWANARWKWLSQRSLKQGFSNLVSLRPQKLISEIMQPFFTNFWPC